MPPFMEVRGKAVMKPGQKVILELQPETVGRPVSTPPEPKDVIQQIADGTLLVHPSKVGLSARRVQMQIGNIQRTLGLQAGADGEWTTQAHEKLTQWLLKSERKRSRGETPSPHTSVLVVPLEDRPRSLALGDVLPEEFQRDVRNPSKDSCANGEEQAVALQAAQSEEDSGDEREPAKAAGGVKGEAKSTSSSTSSSSSSSGSSDVKRRHQARSVVTEAAEALDNLAPLFVSACKPCKDNVANLQNLLRKALQSLK